MFVSIPEDVRDYFRQNSSVWRARFEERTVGDVRTLSYDEAAQALSDLAPEEANEILSVSLGYVSEVNNRISIYQSALEMLKAERSEREVDKWLDDMGFPVVHNKLGPQLVQQISAAFQAILQVVQNFVKSVVTVLTMKLESVTFSFALSPSVALKFT